MVQHMTIADTMQRSDLHELVYVVWGVHGGKRQVVKVGMASRQSVGDRMRKHIGSSRSARPSRFAAVLAANAPAYLGWDVELYTIPDCEALLEEQFATLRDAEAAVCRHHNKPVGNAWH